MNMRKSRAFRSLILFMVCLVLVFAVKPAAVAHAEEGTAALYTVQSGDSLYKIARKTLGSGQRWKEIYEANKSSIADPALIYSNQVLVIPAGEALTPAVEASNDSSETEQQEADRLAAELYDRSAKSEPAITAALKSLEGDKAHLIGLEYRLKTRESLSRKILTDAHDMEVTPQEAAAAIHDSVRYTFIIDDGDYAMGTKTMVAALASKGITLTKFKNFWADDSRDYQGINANFKDAEGTIFELQFHTPESYDTKENKTHYLYEIIRDEHTSAEEKAKAEQKQKELFKLIPIPEGARELKNVNGLVF